MIGKLAKISKLKKMTIQMFCLHMLLRENLSHQVTF